MIARGGVAVVIGKKIVAVVVERGVARAHAVVAVVKIDEDRHEMIAEADARNIRDHVLAVAVVVVVEIDAVVTVEIGHVRDHARDHV